jgi:hypothetical protein
MMTNADETESIDVEPRTRRAAVECMSVLPEFGDARDAPGLYVVIGENGGGEYLIDTNGEHPRCTCPDDEHNLDPDEACKHYRRVLMADGEVSVPAVDAVDDGLGQHTDATPRVAATDGGQFAPDVTEAVTDDEIAAREARAAVDETDERPDDCDCSPRFEDLPCWPCYRDGFQTPADGNDSDDSDDPDDDGRPRR